MDSRKIIGFGKNSSVVTLPKTWMKQNNLEKGTNVYFQEEGAQLILSPSQKTGQASPRKIVIDVNGKEMGSIHREIIGAYLNTYSIIELKGSDIPEKASKIKESLHNLMALEVMEQTKDMIVAKDFLKIEDISFDDIFQRMHRITNSMIQESMSNLEEDYYESLKEKDLDIHRLFFLIQRAVVYSLENVSIMKKMEKTPIILINDWLLVSNMEKIADEAKELARLLKKVKLPKNELKQMTNLYQLVGTDYSKIMDAFFKRDKKNADEISEIGRRNLTKLEDFRKKVSGKYTERAIENLISMQKNIRYIARIILNVE